MGGFLERLFEADSEDVLLSRPPLPLPLPLTPLASPAFGGVRVPGLDVPEAEAGEPNNRSRASSYLRCFSSRSR